ncbi:MAG: glycosyltransferase [Planctomycetes bacterium]|nr:glycosyltransferase [Planctomycetota bacterium]
MSRFPKLTETFIFTEIQAVEALGVRVEIFPLLREQAEVVHEEAAALVRRARFTPLLSPRYLLDNLALLFSRNGCRYLGVLWTLARANWGSARYLGGALAFFPKAVHLARRMAAEGVEHVHAHFASHPAAVAFAVHRLTGIPYSFTAHGSDLHRDRHMLAEKVAAARFVVAISRYNRDAILRECGEGCSEKVEVIHCGVNTMALAVRRGPTPFGEGRGPFRVLSIGTLHEVKGQRYLLSACRVLREEGLDVACDLVGDGPDRAALVALAARLGLADRTRFHGALERRALLAVLGGADVLAVPSVPTADGRREGIPVVLMEAMATGVPVVASRLSGIPELVREGETGLLVEPRDAAGLARALARLAGDAGLRASLARAGREAVEREFDLATNAARLVELFSGEP